MERTLLILDFKSVGNDFCIVVLRLRQAACLPAQRQLNADIIGFFKQVLKVKRMNPGGMLKHMFFGTAEQTDRKQRTLSRAGSPAGNLQGILGNHAWRRARPVRLVGEFDFDPCRNDFLHVVF